MSVGLAGRRIAVPETRELDVFAQMLERHGANVIRCPLVAIRDVSDPAPVVAWLQRFTSTSPDDFVLLTGEGLERLVGFARRAGGFPDATANAVEIGTKTMPDSSIYLPPTRHVIFGTVSHHGAICRVTALATIVTTQQLSPGAAQRKIS
jgi:Holliday junction resolvase